MWWRRVRLKSLRTIFVIAIIFILVSLFYFNTISIFVPQKLKNLIYTIVIDAGSTGSRIHVFRIIHEDLDNNPKTLDVKLIEETLVQKIKPGLSSYANDPDKAAQSLRPLLDDAMRAIPESELDKSRLVLKATAGLRLLSNEIANKIMNKVKGLLKIYPFKHKEVDIDILDGKYEGVYSWLTLNYALDNFDFSREHVTCSLDLGGGSTQINFIPTRTDTLQKINRSDIVKFTLDEVKYEIYAKSYLGFGLMSARKSIFELESLDSSASASPGKRKLKSICVNRPPRGFTWTHQNVEYEIEETPTSSNHSIFNSCFLNVLKILGENNFVQLDELNAKDVYAFSYFYDRLDKASILPANGEIKIKDIYVKAQYVCDNQSITINIDAADKENAFLCMDLTYIYAVLANGYGLTSEKVINVRREVNKMEISWALGAAFHLIHT